MLCKNRALVNLTTVSSVNACRGRSVYTSLTSSINRYLLSPYYVSGTILGTEEMSKDIRPDIQQEIGERASFKGFRFKSCNPETRFYSVLSGESWEASELGGLELLCGKQRKALEC